MKLTVGHVYDATPVITSIINQERPIPQKGQYRIARLYAKLKPEYELIVAERLKVIEPYGHKVPTINGRVIAPAEQEMSNPDAVVMVAGVPPGKADEFAGWWKDYANEEIEVDVQPIPLDQLDNGSDVASVKAGELIILDDLVKE